jgi:hypothetical protein
MSTPPWTIAFVLLWLLVILVCLIVVGTLRRISGVLERAEALQDAPLTTRPGGLQPGTPLPRFRAQRLNGGWVTDEDVRGSPALILFLSANCPPCQLLARELRRRHELGVPLYIALNERSDAKQLGLESLDDAVTQVEGDLARAFSTNTTPHAFAFDSKSTVVATGTPNTVKGLIELAAAAKGGDASGVKELETLEV